MTDTVQPSKEDMLALANWKMPFGRYKDTYIVDLPEAYLVWFKQKGFPKGRLGEIMETALVVKTNGLEDLVRPLRDPARGYVRPPGDGNTP